LLLSRVCLSVCLSVSVTLVLSEQLNLSQNFFDSLVAPSF